MQKVCTDRVKFAKILYCISARELLEQDILLYWCAWNILTCYSSLVCFFPKIIVSCIAFLFFFPRHSSLESPFKLFCHVILFFYRHWNSFARSFFPVSLFKFVCQAILFLYRHLNLVPSQSSLVVLLLFFTKPFFFCKCVLGILCLEEFTRERGDTYNCWDRSRVALKGSL